MLLVKLDRLLISWTIIQCYIVSTRVVLLLWCRERRPWKLKSNRSAGGSGAQLVQAKLGLPCNFQKKTTTSTGFQAKILSGSTDMKVKKSRSSMISEKVTVRLKLCFACLTDTAFLYQSRALTYNSYPSTLSLLVLTNLESTSNIRTSKELSSIEKISNSSWDVWTASYIVGWLE